MPDVIIKDVPAGAEQDVKEIALEAIEGFINARDVRPSDTVLKFQVDVDTIRAANGLSKKYSEKA